MTHKSKPSRRLKDMSDDTIKVLYAEDSDVLRAMIVQHLPVWRGMLERQVPGIPVFQVHLARDGEVGVNMARNLAYTPASGREASPGEKPDVILMDVRMPGKDGLEAIADIRADPYTADIPIVLLTAFPEDVLDDRAIQERGRFGGADTLLIKPWDWSRLITLLLEYGGHGDTAMAVGEAIIRQESLVGGVAA